MIIIENRETRDNIACDSAKVCIQFYFRSVNRMKRTSTAKADLFKRNSSKRESFGDFVI